MWDRVEQHIVSSRTGAGGHALAVGPDGSQYWAGSMGEIFRTLDDQVRAKLPRRQRHLYVLDSSADGRWLAGCGDAGIVEVWDLTTNALAAERDDSPGARRPSCLGVGFSPDGGTVASSSGGTITLSAPDLQRDMRTIGLDDAWTGRVAWAPDGAGLAAGDSRGRVHAWKRDGTELWATVVATTWVMAVAWSPDGRLIAVAAYDGKCVLLDATTGAIRAIIPRRSTNARSVAFSPDGTLLAVGGRTLDFMPLDVLAMSASQAAARASQRWGLERDPTGALIIQEDWLPHE